MRPTLLVLGLVAFVARIEGSEINRESAFDSVDGFVIAIKAFQPAASQGKLASLFTIPEMGHENHGKAIAASTIQSCERIWADDKSALLFATASPPTVGTYSNIGVLFLLVHRRSGWQIADLLRFTATGKDSGLSAKQTAFAGGGEQLSSEEFPPVVTVNELQAVVATHTRRVPPILSPARSSNVLSRDNSNAKQSKPRFFWLIATFFASSSAGPAPARERKRRSPRAVG